MFNSLRTRETQLKKPLSPDPFRLIEICNPSRTTEFAQVLSRLENRSGPPVRSERGTHYLHSVSQARSRVRETRKNARDPIVAVAVVSKFPRAR